MGGAVVLEMLHLAERSGLTRLGRLHGDAGDGDGLRRSSSASPRSTGSGGAAIRRCMPVPARGVSSARYAAERALALLSGPLRDTMRPGDPWAADAEAPRPSAPPSTRIRPRRDGRRIGTCAARPVAAVSASTARPSLVSAASADSSFTSHLSVVDADGNAVSMTTTVGVLFGSGVWCDGVWLNSVGRNFDARTRGTNRFSNSTMSPTILLDASGVRLVVGAAGSQYIQPATAQVDDPHAGLRRGPGDRPGRAAAAPHVDFAAGGGGARLRAGGVRRAGGAGLRPFSRVGDILFGGVHAVYVTPDGRRIGAADHRRDGFAVAQ